ncbi:DUF4153 domain-containing protein [Janibacter cremeus]|uniref:Signal transduction histidine-protein kinase/phosphatase MprB n=1 Tax=Janibacter cremeus TaxID=1285192 RepID=A0A852VZD1_9MICO|nr:DUF4153 domain-containing protein [Janibacter cremeus]NYF99075.1 signal transduction histidine kinase [Janibacter cremeus]
MSRTEPLVGLSSIRTRLAVLVGASILVAALVGTVGAQAGVPLWLGLPATIALALVVTRWLATGMTTPLRQMTQAAERMARGDYGARITTTGRDEVGTLARAFTTMARDLQEDEENQRRLVATVAHELRTPLSAQRALLENLVDGVTTPNDAALGSALAQSERLSSLVADLLDLSRPDGGIPLNPSRVMVSDLLESAVHEASLHDREVTLVADVDPLDLTITGDRARLAQVTANLLDNAVRHSPSGGTVTVAARREHDQWSLTVTDEGPGLSPERAEHLFHRFGQGGDEGGGTGLGLAIAAWVADMHGGAIRALTPGPPVAEVRGRPRPSLEAQQSTGARMRMTLPVDPTLSFRDGSFLTSSRTEDTTPVDPTDQEHPMTDSTAVTTAAPAAPPSSLLGRWWPERVTTPRPDLLLAALGVGIVAAILLPDNAIGLGMLIVLACGGLAIWLASPRRAARWSWVAGALALPLALTTVLRDNPGFTFIAVAMAGVLAATSCTDARTVPGIIAAVAAWPFSALRGLPLLDRTIKALARQGRTWSVLRTAAVSLVLLLVFGGLLASADAVLGSWAAALVPELSDMVVFRTFTLVFFTGITLAGLYLSINPPHVESLPRCTARIPLWEWAVPLGFVIAVFVAFIVAQAAAMFGGHDYVLRTTGVTYAESAREGFGQLTVATALVLVLVAAVRAWGRVETTRDHRVMTALNAALCVLTLIVVASALRRMALYQEAFGYTVLRVSVDLFEIWLGLIVLAVLVSLFTPTRRWLGRTVLASAAVVTIVWSVGNTSAWVAEHNIERWEASGTLDERYLASLSDDAVPAIHTSALPEDVKACILRSGRTTEAADDGLPGWNLSRERAEEIRSQYPEPDQCVLSDR